MESLADIRIAIRKYGMNSNSFLGLYRGFRYFYSGTGVVPYLRSRRSWVAAPQPLTEPADMTRLFKAFAAAAAAERKIALAIPVSREVARSAEAAGYGILKIGTEPKFDLTRFDPTLEALPIAKQLRNKGAQASEFRPEELDAEIRTELDSITAEWFASRKMVALSFLNTVDPWALPGDKRYFWVIQKRRILAYLAAIPIWSTGGWYLIDLLRPDRSAPGATELLLLEAMRILKADGAREISLGVAPLSGLEGCRDGGYERVYRVLHFIFERGNLFYNFKPLHQFKLKFKPTHSEDSYLVYYPGKLTFTVPRGLFDSFLPNGIIDATLAGIVRGYFRFRLADWINNQVPNILVLRPGSASPGTLLKRLRGTLFWFFLILLFHLAHSTSFLSEAAFSASSPLSPVALLFSPFLHWNPAHLLSNSLMLLFCCGVLEYIAGTRVMLALFAAGALLSNPITSALLYGLSMLRAGIWVAAGPEKDVGTSLAIFSCAGAFPLLFRKGKWVPLILAALAIAAAVFTSSLLSLNHLVALAIGFVGLRIWLAL